MKSITTSIFFLTFSIFGAFAAFKDCEVSPTPDENGDIRVPQGDSVTVACGTSYDPREMTCILKFVNINGLHGRVEMGSTLMNCDSEKDYYIF